MSRPAGVLDAAAPARRRERPFVGLDPFTEEDAPFFFGREDDARIIAANLRSARLTLLYGASGVGKSSVLRAGVIHGLRRRLEADARRHATGAPRPPPFSITYFNGWRDGAPLGPLMEAIRAATSDATGGLATLAPWRPGESAPDALAAWAREVRSLLVVLDQFEEYFLYNPEEDLDAEDTFAGVLPRIVGDPRLPVNVLVSLREDAWAKLDRFKGRIPDLFGNYLRLNALDADAARRAVEGPIDAYNRQASDAIEVERALTDEVLREVAAARLPLAGAPETSGAAGAAGEIETPFLQLVMERLWDETRRRGLEALTEATLHDLGGAETIVREHLERSLTGLDPASQAVVADAFRFLVTPSRSKIAQRISDLAYWTDRPVDEVRPVLRRLAESGGDGDAGARVLRPLPPAPGEADERYELFHDVLGEPVLQWRRRYVSRRAEESLTARLEEDRRRERTELAARRSRLVRWFAVAVTGLAVALAVAVVVAVQQRREANSRALTAFAQTQRASDPELSVVLARLAWDIDANPQAEQALRQSVGASRIRGRIPVRGRGLRVDACEDGTLLAVVEGSRMRVWRVREGRWLDGVALAPGGRIAETVWSSDGRAVAALGDRRVAVRRLAAGARTVTVAPAGTVGDLALSQDGRQLVTAAGAVAEVWDTATGRSLARREHPLEVESVDVGAGPAASVATATCADGNVRLWDWRGDRVRILRASPRGSTHPPSPASTSACAAVFSPDGRWLATAVHTRVPRLWSGGTGRYVATLDGFALSDEIAGMGWSANGNALGVITRDNRMSVLRDPADASGFGLAASVRLPGLEDDTAGRGGTVAGERSIVGGVFSADGSRIAVGTGAGLVLVADTATGDVELELRGHRDRINDVAFAGAATLVSASDDGSVRIWDATIPRDVLPGGRGGSAVGVVSAAFSPDGKRIAVGTADGTADVVAVGGGDSVPVITYANYTNVVRFQARGEHVVVAAGDVGRRAGRVIVADARTGSDVERLSVAGEIIDADPAPDGRRVLLVTDPHGIAWHDLRTGAVRAFPWPAGEFAASARLSRDARRVLAAGSDGVVRIFDAGTRRLETEFRRYPGRLTGAVFSRDERRIAAYSNDGLVRVLDVEGRREVATLRGHTSTVMTAAFSPDGRWIATGSTDDTVRVWSADTGQELLLDRVHKDTVNSVAFDPTDPTAVLTASNDGSARIVRCRTCGSMDRVLELSDPDRTRDLSAAERRDFLE